ncbi:hypothetical protein [Duganella aquatilis]|uniref:hypothetical protein n=1 Tax=Duganella aquatilis TaxID=2666082 RepID=UPI00353082D6
MPTTRVLPPGAGSLHIILAVTDHGTPRLTRYKRIIVNVVGYAPTSSIGDFSRVRICAFFI